jgi:hypothetical protein
MRTGRSVLVRIKRPVAGSVDGVALSQFDAGRVYSVSAEMAAFLLALSAADPVDDDAEELRWTGRGLPDQPSNGRWRGPERRRLPR